LEDSLSLSPARLQASRGAPSPRWRAISVLEAADREPRQGTQEQIAVLTRLGFAELLLDQGRPATVILDDALVFPDDNRIEQMFDIMTRAARRMQIIILTCRKRLFTRLGG